MCTIVAPEPAIGKVLDARMPDEVQPWRALVAADQFVPHGGRSGCVYDDHP
jgi:hypothetical protein